MCKPNLEFPQAFFEGGEIDGFYVEGMMRRAWAAEMEVLFEVDRICKKYNIDYFADSGTLLGAVRHKGYIPWDDDIDIVMLRKDYNRFVSVIRSELPKGFLSYYAYFDTYKYDPHMCVFNSDVYCTEIDYLERFHGFPYPAGIDIFPLDTVPADEELVEIHKHLLSILAQMIRKEDMSDKTMQAQLQQLEELLGIHINRNGDIRRQLARLQEEIVQTYQEEEGSLVTIWDCYRGNSYPALPREWFENKVELPFEIIQVPAVANYDAMLRAIYGDDYMIPKIGGTMHEYPFYNKIRRQVEEKAKEIGLENFESM